MHKTKDKNLDTSRTKAKTNKVYKPTKNVVILFNRKRDVNDHYSLAINICGKNNILL